MKKVLFLALLIAGFAQSSHAQVAKMQSVFIYNFTKYFQWPSSYTTGDFVIGVLGAGAAITPELQDMAATKRAGNQPIVVKTFNSTSEITNCHMLFVPKNQSANLATVLQKVGTNSTLVITENEGLAQSGAAINFVIRDNKQKFELNVRNATKYNISVLEALKELAILVN